MEGSAALQGRHLAILSTFQTSLRGEGLTVAGPDANAVDLLECESRACTQTVLDGLSADFGVALALWARARGGVELGVTLYMPDGTTRDLSGVLDGDGVATTRQLALDVARGFRAFEPVPEVAIAPTEARSPGTRTRVSPFNYVLGGAGLALAVPALVSGLRTIARDGECTETESGDCDMPAGVTRVVRPDGRTAALLTVGAGLVGVSAYLFIKRPIRVGIAPAPGGAHVVTHVTF